MKTIVDDHAMSSFYRYESGGPERSRSLPKVTQLWAPPSLPSISCPMCVVLLTCSFYWVGIRTKVHHIAPLLKTFLRLPIALTIQTPAPDVADASCVGCPARSSQLVPRLPHLCCQLPRLLAVPSPLTFLLPTGPLHSLCLLDRRLGAGAAVPTSNSSPVGPPLGDFGKVTCLLWVSVSSSEKRNRQTRSYCIARGTTFNTFQ